MKLYEALQALIHKRKLDERLSEELWFHLESEIEKNLQSGMSSEEARDAALREFGGVEQTREKCRDVWGIRWLEDFWQDLRYSLRRIRFHWFYTVIMTLILGVGIGANCGIFSLIESIFLRPLPVVDPGQLAVGRIVPQATLPSAQTEMKIIARQLEQTYPASNDKHSLLLRPVQQARFWPSFREPIIDLLRLMQISGLLLLLIVCLTAANLLLSQLASRRKEMGIRLALGAGVRRLMRQLLTETLVVSFLGAALSSFVSFWMIRILPSLPIPFPIPLQYEPRYNLRVLLFSLLVTVVCTLTVGLFPVIHLVSQNLIAALKSATQPAGGWKRYSARQFLVAAQIAFSLALSISAGLLARSFWHLKNINPGIAPDGLSFMELSPMEKGGSMNVGTLFYREIIPLESRWPQLRGMAAAANTPFSRVGIAAMQLQKSDGNKYETVVFQDYVSPEYFQTLGLDLISGRDFTRLDVQNKTKVLIVNQTLTLQIWPGQNPLGRKLHLPKEPEGHEIVGVVKDLRSHDLWELPRPCIYLPLPLDWDGEICLLLRIHDNPRALLNALSQHISALDENFSVQSSGPMSAQLEAAIATPKMLALFSSLTAILTVFLAGLGIFGVLAQMVLAGSREIGLRIALGANSNDIGWLIARSAVLIYLGGIAFGIPLAWGLAQILAHRFHGISKTDALTFLGLPVAMGIIVFIACFIPFRRAIRVDPLVALRSE